VLPQNAMVMSRQHETMYAVEVGRCLASSHNSTGRIQGPRTQADVGHSVIVIGSIGKITIVIVQPN
jgi:hypothetical protein